MQKNGFLPVRDPLVHLPTIFKPWEEVANRLPKLLISHGVRDVIEKLPPFPVSNLKGQRQFDRAMLLLSYLGHAYVWGGGPIPEKLPGVLAKPWYDVSQFLGRSPVLSYASYALNNWYRINPALPIELGNIALIQNFLGGMDEEWFILVHVDIECKAIPALAACNLALKKGDPLHILTDIQKSLEAMLKTLKRMPERCDPYIYYHRVRPYIHGWKNHPNFPKGLIYEGAFQNQPQPFRGETGAQSGIIPCLDAVLGITHEQDELHIYLQEMRDYMPPQHRAFLIKLEQKAQLRHQAQNGSQNLKSTYNHCLQLLSEFRSIHLQYAATYIHHQAEISQSNPHVIGTGGTPFMQYLKKHRDETLTFLL